MALLRRERLHPAWPRDCSRRDNPTTPWPCLQHGQRREANDPEGQNLLAEALRIDPGSRLAKLAFERMEGIAGDHKPLEEAIARWSAEEIARVDGEMARPAFLRAQVGFNNNVKYKSQTFHIQTEDSGLDKPHVITHLFADGGRVIKSHKRSYAEHVRRPDIGPYVRQLMKGQQLEMAFALRDGRFDAVIEGRAMGGMDVLDYPPKADLQKLATKKKTRVPAEGEISRPPRAGRAVQAGRARRIARRGTCSLPAGRRA